MLTVRPEITSAIIGSELEPYAPYFQSLFGISPLCDENSLPTKLTHSSRAICKVWTITYSYVYILSNIFMPKWGCSSGDQNNNKLRLCGYRDSVWLTHFRVNPWHLVGTIRGQTELRIFPCNFHSILFSRTRWISFLLEHHSCEESNYALISSLKTSRSFYCSLNNPGPPKPWSWFFCAC